MRISIHSVAVALVMLVALNWGVCAFSKVVEPSTPVAGATQAEWSARWWQWYLSFPNDMRPETGEFSHLGEQGPVFFLSASSGQPIMTNVSIDHEQFIFLTLLGAWAFSESTDTEEDVRTFATEAADSIDSLFLRIDGVDAPVELFSLRQESPTGLFDVSVPENNLFGLPAAIYPSASDGFYAMLEPLTLGQHTIEFGGTVDGGAAFAASTTANVTIVPEPSAAMLILVGLVTFVRWRRMVSVF